MKNLFKKIGALLVAAVMVLSMCTAAFAAVAGTSISVNNAEGAKLSYIQVIHPNVNKTTGWEFCSTPIANAYETALGVTDDQAAIQKLINNAENKADAATSSQIEAALSAVINLGNLTDSDNPISVSDAGVYAINAVDTTGKWSYSPMAAYVSFGTYDTKTGEPATLSVDPVNAKRTPKNITKEVVDNKDNVTEIGREETYKVTSSVPYIPLSKTVDRYYKIKDTIKGAKYVTTTKNGKKYVSIDVKIGNDNSQKEAEVTENANGTQSFVLDLSDLVKDENGAASNAKANVEYSFTYKATVTDIKVNNHIIGYGENDQTPTFGGGDSNLYTGEITLTKYASDENNNDLTDNVKLANAEFKMYKKIGNDKKWAKFGNDYKFIEWVNEESKATNVKTDANGTLTVQGLDVEEAGIEYFFKEVKAPSGYSITDQDVSATLKFAENVEKATDTISVGTHMIDTKLSSLPSTGGMGTYLFTIIGVVVMAGAAGAFFISRRKGSEE